MKSPANDKEKLFIEITDQYKEVVAKVCGIYSSGNAPFDDLYQEVLINIWQGLESYRGEAKISTWIYRTAINTCITWHRRNGKHSAHTTLESIIEPSADDSSDFIAKDRWAYLQKLVSKLSSIDKAILSMWLDERPYDEISQVTGLAAGTIAVRLHRIKHRLQQMAGNECE